MKISKEQEIIIDEPINNILVSAAAGSGKTTVLVERIITKIIKGEVTIDKLLLMTFTKAAAENMSMKINHAIKKKIKEETDPFKRKMLKEQLNLLPSAYIHTIDSFCARVIREKGSEAVNFSREIGFLPVSGPEKELLLRTAASEAVKDRYKDFNDPKSFSDTDFYRLTTFFGDGRNDDELITFLVNIFKQLRSLPYYIDLIERIVSEREENDHNNHVLYMDNFILRMKDYFAAAKVSAEKGLDDIPFAKFTKAGSDVTESILRSIIRECDIVSSLDENSDESFNVIAGCFERIAQLPDSGFGINDKEYKETVAPAFALLYFVHPTFKGIGKDFFSNISIPFVYRELLNCGVEGLIDLQIKRTSIVREFKDLLVIMDKKYADLKEKAHVMDFQDMEHYALEILSDPQVCSFYRDKFMEIYVDEYQDDSTLQDAIVEKFANNNLFMVGDVKQSIYRFRYANPKLFNNRMTRYDAKDGGIVLRLNQNFRCSPEIIKFVNVIFDQLMSGTATEIEYDVNHELHEYEKTPHGDIPSVVLVDERPSGNEVEEEFDAPDFSADFSSYSDSIVAELKGIIREVKNYLKDPAHEPKDICILVRKNDRARIISQVLNRMGIPASCGDSRTLYEDNEIASLCALIMVLGNQHRDDCLFGVMMANFRFSNFTLDDVAKIVLYADNNSLSNTNLIEKLRLYYERKDPDDIELYKRVQDFVDKIDELRSEAMMFNISELIEKIYAATGILANVKKMGVDEVKKLRKFKDWLCESFMDRGSDIASISATLDELKISFSSKASFELGDEDRNAVNLMTFHKSKGLEFPFVIVTQLNEAIKDDATFFSFDERHGFVSQDFYDDEVARKCDSFESLMYAQVAHLESVSEALRLLYVAMTRAKNKLSIVSFYHPVKTRNGIFNIAQREKDLKFSRSVHLSINNTLEELIIALLRISKAADLKEEMGVVDSGYIESVSNFAGFNFEYINNEDVDIFETIRDFDSDDVETVHLNVEGFDINGNPIFPEYKYEKSVNAASKTSVSEMKREELKLSLDTVDEKERRRLPINLIVPKPEYYDPKNTYSSASSKGTLIHNLLHFFDFPSMLEAMESGRNANEALKLELDYLKERGVIKDNMIPVVESFEKELSSFLVSDLFKRITKAEIADKAYFEQPIMFSIGVKDTDDDTLVQGVLDVMFMEGDEAVIVDYKTDRIGSDDDTEIKKILEEKHKLQLDLYAASVEASGIKVKEKIIWLVRKGREFVL